ncbi:MAG: translation initiation factor IF-2 [bacterium]|nr:translation initiation factor IF-2 [bacterium]
MGKIRLSDLAHRMGLPEQDLMFKLKSIGVRIEGDDAAIDSDIIQAIMQGKRLPQPREVIIRDDSESPVPVAQATGQPQQGAPLLPRGRAMIHRVEDRIRELPVKERPAAEPADEPTVEAPEPTEAAAEAEVTKPAAAAKLAEPAKPEKAAAAKAKPAAAGKAEPAKPAPKAPARPAAPISRPAGARPTTPQRGRPTPGAGPGRARRPTPRPPVRPGRPPKRLPPGLRGHRDDMRRRRPRRPADGATPAVREEIKPLKPASARGHRRAQRREETADQQDTLQFRDERPTGPVAITNQMTVREFAEKLGVKSKDLLKTLFMRGMMVNINHVLDPDTAIELATELGVEALEVSFEEEVQLQHETEIADDSIEKVQRAPVVTVMGHVDHGKTTLLDVIRSTKVVEGEAGGITQHIGAYHVEVNDKPIVFLDTPGHEAFTMMRARGAGVTDIVVLVVAADDGVMPQTIEAIDHARAAEVPIVVAINKVDKQNANLDRVRKDLADHNLMVEDWGGDVVSVAMSALKGEGVSALLEMLLLTADLLELKAAPSLPAQGVILEARKEVGRGIIATMLVQDGTLQTGDVFVAGSTWGRVRSMTDDRGKRLKNAGPATPVEVTGFNDLPAAGDVFQVFADEAKARGIAGFRSHEERQRELAPQPNKMSLEQLFDQIGREEVKELSIILKADVQGSVEVLRDTLEKLSTDKVQIKVIQAAVGAISTTNVQFASASNAIIIGFNVRPERNAATLAEKEGVEIRLHTVIYELADEIKRAMTGLLEPTFKEVHSGTAEIRDTFKVPKIGVVAGCYITDGVIPRSAGVRLLRDNVVVYEGKISSLRRFKDDVSEVRSGFECGIGLEQFQDVKPGDQIEAFVREEVAPTL